MTTPDDHVAYVTRQVDDIIDLAFGRPRDPRSPMYVAGARTALMHHALGAPVRCPHPMGTPEADAWFAGVQEGVALWRDEQQRQRVAQASMQMALRRACQPGGLS